MNMKKRTVLKVPSLCNGCGACIGFCTKKAISFKANRTGFYYPIIDSKKCNNCGVCTLKCPISHQEKAKDITPKAFACVNKNKETRLESSSGGIFSLLAEDNISRGGVVFGAKFDESFNICHGYTESMDDIKDFRGSKYSQSPAFKSFADAEKFLKHGRQVLFSGTPCQIARLKAYLGKDYENLFCVDIICHGVSSPKVWKQYVHFREARAGAPARRISFRAKPWKRFSVLFSFENNTEYLKVFSEDAYMRLFLADIDLRSSCYSCAYKSLGRAADITLADFWGIENILPEMDDDTGTSLVFIHSEKGADVFKKLSSDMLFKEVSAESSVMYNAAAIRSAKAHPKRKEFFERLGNEDFEELARSILHVGFVHRTVRFAKRSLSRIWKFISTQR